MRKIPLLIPFLSFLSLLCISATTAGDRMPVNEIYQDVPNDLSTEVLLIPRFDLIEPDEAPPKAPRDYAYRVNQEAKRCNTTMFKIAQKRYPFKFQMVSLSEIEEYKAQGHRYFLDMVIMPKQMETVKKEAMVPAYLKYKTANRMFRNQYAQFQYYFYIRDLQNDNAYVTSRLKGHPEAFEGYEKFFKQLHKDLIN